MFLKYRIFSISFALFILLPVFAQFEPVAVEKSSQKIINQGKVFYLHTVKKGHTLYSICKTYGTNESEIAKANPGVSLNVLSEGQVLKIPVEMTKTETSKPVSRENIQEFFYHTVQPKQTVYYLHQKYNVPLEVIYKFNPGVEQGVQTGQVLKIPKNFEVKDTTVIATPEVPGNKYTIKYGDTLYVIADSFGIPVADIINANQQLRWGLKPGQTIIIPYQPSSFLMSAIQGSDTVSPSYLLPQYGVKECDSIARTQTRIPVRVALILPFYTSDMYIVDTLQFSDTIDDGSGQTKTNTFRGRGAVEFYEGLLFAIDTLKQQGINIQLYVYDTEGDTNKVKSILKEIDKIQPSLIIGPFLPDNVRLVSQYCQKNGIPFVPPLMNDDEIARKNTFLYQVNPSLQSEIVESTNYLSRFYNQNVILAYKPEYIDKENIELFKKLLHDKSLLYLKTDTFCFQEVILDDNIHKNMSKFLRNGMKNVFILLSNNEPDVSNILSQLYFSSKYYDIEVFGLPQWQKFTNVSIEHMHGLQVTLFSPYFIDYNAENTKKFISKFRNQLGFEPYKTSLKGTGMNYSFLGYDIGLYFIKAINLYGKNATLCSDVYKPESLLISDYNFERTMPIGCIENTSVNIIRYTKEFGLEKANTPLQNQ
jgi:LysM repeat protein/ABC-type branched-subunit amino acid transport system substrate-binding protein